MTYKEKRLELFDWEFMDENNHPWMLTNITGVEIKDFLAESISQAEQEMREKIKKEITVIFSGEEKDLQDLLNAPSLKVNK